MGIARFIARDPYTPPSTSKTALEELLTEMSGVLNWSIQPNGQVTIEYDPDLVSISSVEEGLDGLGYRLEHIFDERGPAEAGKKEH